MDANRFDALVRSLPVAIARRATLAGMLGVGLAAMLARAGGEDAAAKKKKRKKKRKKKCKAPRVKCGKACCPDGQACLNGQCGAPPPSPPPPPPPSPPPPPPPPGPNPACQGPLSQTLGGFRRFAQAFTAERTGLLAAAQCQVTGLAGGEDFTLEIRTLDGDGVPTATILAVDTLSDAPAVSDPNALELRAVFDPPAPVETGVGYAFVVTIGEGQLYRIFTRNGNDCPDQQLFADPTANGTFLETAKNMDFAASIVV